MFENILAENHQHLLHLLPARHEVDISATLRRTHSNLMMDLITYDAYEDNMLEISGSLQWNTNKEPGGNNSEIET